MYPVFYSLKVYTEDFPLIPEEDKKKIQDKIQTFLLNKPLIYSKEVKTNIIYRKMRVDNYIVLFSALGSLGKVNSLLISAIKNKTNIALLTGKYNITNRRSLLKENYMKTNKNIQSLITSY